MTARSPSPSPTAEKPRLFTRPLTIFLTVVAVLAASGLWQKQPRPDLAGGVRLLADGDLDGEERLRMLQRVLAQAAGAENVTEHWAGLLAAVSLADREGWQRHLRALGGGDRPTAVPPPAERTFLDLGDRMLGSVLAAGVAEVAGDNAGAKQHWSSVQTHARLSGHAFGRELATAALQRLP
jgi:hypothetical protein